MTWRAALLSILLLLPQTVEGSLFGKNKVRYREQEWSVIETAHLRIHFYQEEEELALETVPLAEAIYTDLSERLGHAISRPIPIILYASHPEFQRTHASPGWIDESTGGLTEFLKGRVLLPYPGSREEYRHVLQHEMAHAFQLDILDPGGSPMVLAEVDVPLWVIEGMAEYLSRPERDSQTALWIRDALLDGSLPSFEGLAYLNDLRVYRFGHSAWAFLAAEYGEETLGDFLRTLGSVRGWDPAMRIVFGKGPDELSEEWAHALRKEHFPGVPRMQRAAAVGKTVAALGRMNLAPAISPDGERLVFLSDRDGALSLCMTGREGQGAATLVREGTSGRRESLRPFHGGARWSPCGRYLLFPVQSGEEDRLHLYDVERRRNFAVISLGFDEIRGLAWSPDGEQVVFSGLRGGRSDLYLYGVTSGMIAPLTADEFVYVHPDWSPDGRTILCATDRVGEERPGRNRRLRPGLLDLRAGAWSFPPSPDGDSHSPLFDPDGEEVLFVCDAGGSPDLYTTSLTTKRVRRLSFFEGGISGLLPTSRSLASCRETGELYLSLFRHQSWSIVRIDDPRLLEGEEALVPAEEVLLASDGEGARLLPPPSFFPPYRILPYRPKLSTDFRAGGAGISPSGPFSSASSLLFSDDLGDHQVEVALGVYGSLRSSDLYAAYEDRSRRTARKLAFFQFLRRSSAWAGTAGGATVYRGVRLGLSYPLDRYRRIEGGIRIGEGRGPLFHGAPDSGEGVFAGVQGAYVVDRVRWGRSGAEGGRRFRVSAEPLLAGGLGGWVLGDARFYAPFGERVVLALRSMVGGRIGGNGPALYAGTRTAVRGFSEELWEERSHGAQSVELRFPLIDRIRLGWPFPLSVGGIGGVLFADAGIFEGERSRVAYGPGVRLGIGPVRLMLDFPELWADGERVGKASGYFRIGSDF